MKNLIKFSSVALAVLAMSSCADDLGFVDNFNGKITDKSELIGVLDATGTTRTGMVDDRDALYPIVWTKGDSVNVYSLSDRLTYATYKLKEGEEGKRTGKFGVLYPDNIDLIENRDLYAVTSSKWVYGVSATQVDADHQKALLTVDIPKEFGWEERDGVEVEGTKYYYNNAPYWGAVEGTNNEGQMNVQFKKLVGTIKIDAALLPKNTKAIVVATPADKPLSGRFKAVLDTEKADDCVLGADPYLVNFNQIRAGINNVCEVTNSKSHSFTKDPTINNTSNTRVFFIPLICGSYEWIDVIAILHDESDKNVFVGDNFTTYIPNEGDRTYRGLEGTDWVRIKKYENVEVTNKKVLETYPAVEQNLDNMTPMQISERIALAYDDRHDFIFNITNIKMDNSYQVVYDGTKLQDDNTIYIPNNKIDSYRMASITLNFKDESLDNQNTEKKLFIKEAKYNFKDWHANAYSEYGTDSRDRTPDTRGGLIGTYEYGNNTTGNIPAYTVNTGSTVENNNARVALPTDPSSTYMRKVNINLNGPVSIGHQADVDIYLPTSRLTLKHYVDGKTYGAKNSAGDVYGKVSIIAEKSNNLNNEYQKVDSKKENAAGVNIMGDFQKVEILASHTGGVNVEGSKAKAKNVTVEHLVINNSESGVVKIDDASVANVDFAATQKTNQYVYTVGSAALKELTDKSDKVRVRAFWTGVKLTEDQIAADYDQTEVFTAAQLSCIGEHSVDNYKLSEKTEHMHLGGSAYPWEGAVIDNETSFTLQGGNVELRSMKMSRSNGTASSHGLISSIKTKGDVTINDIHLYEALTEAAVDNIGAIVGSIETEGKVTFGGKNTEVEDITFKNTKNNVGGLVGYIKASEVNYAATKFNVNRANIDGTNNVGGMGGYIETTGMVYLKETSNINIIATDITAKADNVGGVFGNVIAGSNYRTWSKLTLTADNIKAGGMNAGGVVGVYNTDAQASFASKADKPISVTVGEISAVGKLTEDKIYGNVGGLVGNADAGALTIGSYASVSVKAAKLASNCHVGGLVGLCNTPATLNGATGHLVTVNVSKFENTIGDPAKYKSTEQYNAIGTFGGVIGKANSGLTIASSTGTVVIAHTTLLSKAAREALYFTARKSEQVNVNGKKLEYWGDNNNYVGYLAGGYHYVIGGNEQTVNSDYNQYVDYTTKK